MPTIKLFNKYEILRSEDLNNNFTNLKEAIEAIDNLGITGCVLPFAGTIIPSGWLLCDGSAINRINYSALFAIIGTRYGQGDGINTFNLPDFRGRTFWGGDTTNAGTNKSAGLPNITGGLAATQLTSSIVKSGAFVDTYNDDYTYSNSSGSDKHGHIVFDAAKGEVHNGSYSNLIYGKSDTVQPPAIQVPFIIKY